MKEEGYLCVFIRSTMAKALIGSINYWTALILGDTERPRENEPSCCRRLCRFVLTILAILGFIAIFTTFLVNQPPKRSQRVWITKEEADDVVAFLDRKSNHLNSIEWQCPCKVSNVVVSPPTSTRIVEFLLVDIHHPNADVPPINSLDQFCRQVSRSRHIRGFSATCKEILTESFRLSGWDFGSTNNLYTNSLKMGSLNPVSFMFDVCMSWAGALSQASSSFLLSNFDRKGARRLTAFLGDIKTSLLTCAEQSRWPPPDPSVYVKKGKTAAVGSERLDDVVVVRFNWTEYYRQCAPSYCEHVTLNSSTWVLFATFVQVGGFVSCAISFLRYAVWPLICMLSGWRSGDDLIISGDDSKGMAISNA